jgi:hypothetical protein
MAFKSVTLLVAALALTSVAPTRSEVRGAAPQALCP